MSTNLPEGGEEGRPTAGSQASDPLARIHQLGDYELLEVIARDERGVVFQARQVSRDRIVALSMNSGDGLQTVAGHHLVPDLVYLDADHSSAALRDDLALCARLFPQATLIGDDDEAPDVRQAVEEFARQKGLTVISAGSRWQAWKIVPRAK